MMRKSASILPMMKKDKNLKKQIMNTQSIHTTIAFLEHDQQVLIINKNQPRGVRVFMICVGVWRWDYTPNGTSMALPGSKTSSSLMGTMRKRTFIPSCLILKTVGSEKSSRSFWTSSTVQTAPSGRPWVRHRCFKLNKIRRAMFSALSPRNALIRFFVHSRHQWRFANHKGCKIIQVGVAITFALHVFRKKNCGFQYDHN